MSSHFAKLSPLSNMKTKGKVSIEKLKSEADLAEESFSNNKNNKSDKHGLNENESSNKTSLQALLSSRIQVSSILGHHISNTTRVKPSKKIILISSVTKSNSMHYTPLLRLNVR